MKFIHDLLRQLSPNEEIKDFAEKEGLLSERQDDLQNLGTLSIQKFLAKPENAEYASQHPLNEDFSRCLALQLLLKDKDQLDALYMELVEDSRLNLKENDDTQGLTGLFWNVIMEKEKAEKNGVFVRTFHLNIEKLREFKEANSKKINESILEVNRLNGELAKLQEGLATYNHQIDKLLKEKAAIQQSHNKLDTIIVLSEAEEKENQKIVERLKWLESKIRLHQQKIKSLKVFQENGVKKYRDLEGKPVSEETVRAIKTEYRKLLETFGIEEEKIKKTSGASVENKLNRKKYEERINAINENINHLEKTRKAYHDYKVILNGRYEEALQKVFQDVSRGEKADISIDFYNKSHASFESSLVKLGNEVETTFILLQETQMGLQEMRRIHEVCTIQEELIQYEYASLDELFRDIEKSKLDVDAILEKHHEFNERFEAISRDFSDSKLKGNLLSPEKIGFFRSVLLAKRDEAKELHKQYLSYRKLHDTLLQNYDSITRSLQNNEKQYKEQFERIREGRERHYEKTVELEKSQRVFVLRKDYLKLLLLASPLAVEEFSKEIVRLEENLGQLRNESKKTSQGLHELKGYTLIPFQEIPVVNNLLEEFGDRDAVKVEVIEAFIEELNTLMKLDREFGGLGIGAEEENSVSSEIMKAMSQKMADLANELSLEQKAHEADTNSYLEQIAAKEREIEQRKAEVEKLASVILDDHTREEKLLAALDEERKRNKELQSHIFTVEERFALYRNSPFWKKNFVNTVSTFFFIGGLFYSIITDLPWDQMQLNKAVPFLETTQVKENRQEFLFAEHDPSMAGKAFGIDSYLTPAVNPKKHLIIDLPQYKVSVDASSFTNIYEGDFRRSDLEEIIMAEINHSSREMDIDFNSFLEFYKSVYPNCSILKRENIEQATSTVYALREKYIKTKRSFATLEEQQDYSGNVLQLLTRLQLRVEDRYSSFIARLFNEHYASGYSASDAKEAILNNLASIQKQYRDFFIPTYKGEFKPDERIERMGIEEFVAFASPYIKSRYYSFARRNGLALREDVNSYVHSLAEDIFYSSEFFNVPKTMAMLIAHQETFFHNMVGDQGKSEGPFQIYLPTKKVILKEMARRNIDMPEEINSLIRHRTFSTVMATFYMSELMSRYSDVSFRNGKGYIEYDLRKCAISYNGSEQYYYDLMEKKEFLNNYLEEYLSKG